jgi:hypothetical protein
VSRTVEQFKEGSAARQALTVGALAVSLGLVAVAERDIQRRPVDQMRGGKLPWRLACLNALGAVGYFLWGRQTPQG